MDLELHNQEIDREETSGHNKIYKKINKNEEKKINKNVIRWCFLLCRSVYETHQDAATKYKYIYII